MSKIYTIFFLIGARHRASVDEKKNRMRRHTIFHSYCRYYSRHAIVVMTVVTTVAMENRMTTHAIFFLIYRCPMLGTDFKKKSSFKDDDAKVRAALPGAKEQRAKNDNECAFAVVAAIAGISRVRAGSSRVFGTIRNCVSLRPRECAVMTVLGKCECSS